jgi:hypothetical protein
MVTTIAVIIRTRMKSIVVPDLVLPTPSDVPITDVYPPPGIATVTRIAMVEKTNPKINARPKVGHVSATCSLATMAIASPGSMFATVITTAWIIRTKAKPDNAKIESAIPKLNSLAKPIENGVELSASKKNGFAMETLIVSMVRMRTRPRFKTAL